MIRILHTADWHIGHNFFGYDRTSEHLHFFEWLIGQLSEHKINALLVSGDIFDSMNPSPASQRMFFNFIRRAKKENPGLQMVFTAGSHDSPGRLEAPMPLLEDLHIQIKGQPLKLSSNPILDNMIVPLTGDSGNVEVQCLVIPHVLQSDYSEKEAIGQYYSLLLENAFKVKKPEQALVALGYLNLAEVQEQYPERELSEELKQITPDIFDDSVIYTGLGYKHGGHKVEGYNIWYAGSPLPMSFRDCDCNRGCVFVTIDDTQQASVQQLVYEPSVKLLSFPPDRPCSEAGVVKLLADLPEKTESSSLPFVEVRILIDQPDPLLRMRIERILATKAVRLCRIITIYQSGGEQYTEDEIMTMGLQNMSPLQIARITYEKAYQEEMPLDLEELLNEICDVIK